MNTNKKLMIAGVLSTLLAAPMVANAAFNFDPAGTGATVANFDSIKLADGNVLAQGGETAINTFAATGGAVQSPFMLYFQANLGSFNLNGSPFPTYTNSAAHPFTIVSGVQEIVTGVANTAAGAQTNASFALSAAAAAGGLSTINFFNIYASATGGNNATGTGFSNGTLIFSAHAIAENSSSFTVSNTTPVNLQTPGVTNPTYTTGGVQRQTVSGSGNSNLTLVVDFADSNYFTNLLVNGSTTFVAAIPSLNTPYNATQAATCFNTNVAGSCDGGTGYAPIFGLVNGLPGTTSPDFIAQSTNSASFSLVQKVPEPATTALFGLGLAFLGLFGVARRKNSI